LILNDDLNNRSKNTLAVELANRVCTNGDRYPISQYQLLQLIEEIGTGDVPGGKFFAEYFAKVVKHNNRLPAH
jgi:hypothetical protein